MLREQIDLNVQAPASGCTLLPEKPCF